MHGGVKLQHLVFFVLCDHHGMLVVDNAVEEAVDIVAVVDVAQVVGVVRVALAALKVH